MVSTRSVEVTYWFRVPTSLYPMTLGSNIETAWPSITASASIPPELLLKFINKCNN